MSLIFGVGSYAVRLKSVCEALIIAAPLTLGTLGVAGHQPDGPPWSGVQFDQPARPVASITASSTASVTYATHTASVSYTTLFWLVQWVG